MYEELTNELIEAKEQVRKKRKYENLARQAWEAWQMELHRKFQLERALGKEDADVKKLEAPGIAGLFLAILGSKERQLEKERQELLAARLKYDECCQTVINLRKEMESCKATRNSLVDAETRYQAAFKRKEQLILQTNDDNAHRLLQLMEETAGLEADKKELQEAIESGQAVQRELTGAKESLESARGWGAWDMLGGGVIATAIKHSEIDNATERAYRAKTALRRFQNELADVKLRDDIEIEVGSFERFADYFFDGLISDWVVQSRIIESLSSVNSVLSHVNSIVSSLQGRLSRVEYKLNSIKNEMESLIEQA